MRVGVIGTGYVGSVTGACLAKEGHDVTLVDINQDKVDAIMFGYAPIEEPGLDEIIRDTVREKSLRATTNLGRAVSESEVILLSLPTPSRPDDSANLDAVYAVASELGEYIRPDSIIATRSTVPVGTTERVRDLVAQKANVNFFAISNPEFLAEGTAVRDTLHPSRIIIGTDSDQAEEKMRNLYHPFVLDDPNKIITMDIRSAEITKLAANTILAANITVINVIAEICEREDADYRKVQQGLKTDPRIGTFLHPGPGYGGSCFPKDVRSLAFIARELGLDTSLLESVTNTNEHMKSRLYNKVRDHFNNDLEGKKIAVWGLSFKPNTDDVRESAALVMVRELVGGGAKVSAYDPKAARSFEDEFGKHDSIEYAQDKYQAARDADAVVIVTEWDTFRSVDFEHLGGIMRSKNIFDGRSIYNPHSLVGTGFYYDSVGRVPIQG